MLWTYSTISQANNDIGFDEICRIYSEAVNSSMKKEQLSNYIFKNVQERVSDKAALEVHDIIFQVEPEKRYKLFKQSAELSLKRKWDCLAVKLLIK